MDKWPILIITLRGAESRCSGLVSDLNELGLSHTLHHGQDCRDSVPAHLSPYLDYQKMERRFGRVLSPPEIGCAMSHIRIYERIVNESLEGALILEDDAKILNKKLFFDFCVNRAGLSGNFYQLSYGYARVWRMGLGQNKEIGSINTEKLVHNSGLTTGYSLNAKAARFILDNALPLACVADWPCNLLPLHPHVVVPRLIQGDKKSSTIAKERSISKARRSRGDDKEQKDTGFFIDSTIRNPKPPLYNLFHRYLSRSI